MFRLQNLNMPFSVLSHFVCSLGPSFQVDNYFVVAGMNGQGMTLAPGVGFCLAQWMTKGDPNMNPFMYDIRRFTPMYNNLNFLRSRVVETLCT